MTDHTDTWLAELANGLDDLATRQRKRQLRTVTTLPAHHIQVADRAYLNLASNDYLGFGSDLGLHQEFARALAREETLERVAFTSSASRLLGASTLPWRCWKRCLPMPTDTTAAPWYLTAGTMPISASCRPSPAATI